MKTIINKVIGGFCVEVQTPIGNPTHLKLCAPDSEHVFLTWEQVKEFLDTIYEST